MWPGATAGGTRGRHLAAAAAAAAAMDRAAAALRAGTYGALHPQFRAEEASPREGLPDLNQVSDVYRGGGTYLPPNIRAAAKRHSPGSPANFVGNRQPSGMCKGACALYRDLHGMGWIEVRVVAVHNDPQGGYITIRLPLPHGGERETEPSKLILKSAQRDPRQFPKGRLCLYYDNHSSRWVQATVTAVHSDPEEDFFSIQLPCGANRDTVLANLYPLPAEPTHPPPSGGSSAQPPSAPAHGTRTALDSSRPVHDLEPPAKRGRPSCAQRQDGQSSAPCLRRNWGG